MEKFLHRAIDLAIENVENGGTPYGAVLVKDGIIIGEGVNTLHQAYDVSGHAEMIAIREGQQKLQTNDLSGCIIYASGHPCPMCLGAIGITQIKHVYFANTVEEGAEVGLTISGQIYDYLKGQKDRLDLKIEHIPIPVDDVDPMKLYAKKSR
ncbi:nucleoside deaminase [Erysipelothrix urinaevulpis]|uniref:nucleoside deaminase n=1 Tax=Erysipelothrix urinaevulpis TaxID=2683717 RepID=UPI0013596626|nr:nucleoside deaminase [Erysipelothrix urinaevulpis]